MFEKLVIWVSLIIVFCVLYVILSTANSAYSANERNVALVKIKTRTGKFKFKPIASKKAVLKEFIYKKNFNHLKLKGIKGITAIYMFDRNGELYEFEKNVAKMLTVSQVKEFINSSRSSFLDIYNFMTINKFVGKALRIVDEDERQKQITTKSE